MSDERVFHPTGAPASGRVTPASFPFYTTGEDNLRITSYNSAASVSLKINGRLIDATGRANGDTWDHAPNTDRSAKTTDITLSGSTILNLTVFASAGAPLMGQTYVIVKLIRGIGAGAIVLGTILQGYVTATQALGWPGSPLQNSLDGGGYLRQVQGTTPGAGAEVSETCPAGARWDVLAVNNVLTTGNVGVLWLARLQFVNGGSVSSVAMPLAKINNNTVANFTYAQNMPFGTELVLGNGTHCLQQPMPQPAILAAGDSFRTNTEVLVATDHWSAPLYLVREWLEP